MENKNTNLFCLTVAKKTYLILIILLISFLNAYSQTVILGGNVSGIWNLEGSPYLIRSDINIPAGQTLIIEAGVVIKSDPNVEIIVNGRLRVTGVSDSLVKFTASDKGNGWTGINFHDSANDDSYINFAEIYYAYKGINLDECAARVDSSILAFNTYGIYGQSNMMSEVINNFSALEVYNNVIGFVAGWTFSSNFYNCKFYNNSDKGVSCPSHSGSNDIVKFDHCLIYRNGIGITNEADRRTLILKNCTIAYNASTEVFVSYWNAWQPDPIIIENSIIWGGEFEDGFVLVGNTNLNVSYSNVSTFEGTVAGSGNISSDPLFNDSDNDDYSLQAGSPSIDSGNPNTPDDPDGTRADMGAIYFHHAPAIPVLLSPADNTEHISTDPTLSWSKPAGTADVDSYYLQVSTVSDFSILSVDESYILGSSYQLSGLTNETTYFWRVNATNIGGTSAWSTVFSFKTINIQYTVSTSSNPTNGGTTSGAGTYELGQSVTIMATPYTNYSFINWTENGTQVSTDSNYEFTIISDRNLVANFSIIPSLSVSPAFREVNSLSGSSEFTVLNTTGGTMSWSAVSNADWINIPDDTTGVNNGMINFNYQANAGEARVGTITITAAGATGSPKTVEVRQASYTSVDKLNSGKPVSFKLFQNYPNPFNPTTMIEFQLPSSSFVVIKVFNLAGKEISTLVEKQYTAGIYHVEWNASGLTSGVYYYRIHADKYSETKKMILMR